MYDAVDPFHLWKCGHLADGHPEESTTRRKNSNTYVKGWSGGENEARQTHPTARTSMEVGDPRDRGTRNEFIERSMCTLDGHTKSLAQEPRSHLEGEVATPAPDSSPCKMRSKTGSW